MGRNRNGIASTMENPLRVVTLGWRRTCGCRTDVVAPCIVLDPFVGSGTTVATSIELGRAGVGVDLSDTYLTENAIPRIAAARAGGARRATAVVGTGSRPPVCPMRGAGV